MRKTTFIFALAAILTALASHATPQDEEDTQASKWARLAAQSKPGPCPTKVEVLPYQWIEPTTGVEYTALRLHCPGRDSLDDDPPATSGQGEKAERIPSEVRSAS